MGLVTRIWSGGRGGWFVRRRCFRPSVHVGGPVRGDGGATGEQFPGVLEDDDAVAEQAPALLGMADNGPGSLAVRRARVRTRRLVRAHVRASWSAVGFISCWQRNTHAGFPPPARASARCVPWYDRLNEQTAKPARHAVAGRLRPGAAPSGPARRWASVRRRACG